MTKHDEPAKGKEPQPVKLGHIVVELPQSLLDELGGAGAVALVLRCKLRGCTVVGDQARVELDHS
jgi:hypothetical protein